jgi:hypothetical protein
MDKLVKEAVEIKLHADNITQRKGSDLAKHGTQHQIFRALLCTEMKINTGKSMLQRRQNN